MDIDIYDFKETLKKFENDDFIEFAEDKGVAIIEVGKTRNDIDKELIEKGYKIGERLLVVVQ